MEDYPGCLSRSGLRVCSSVTEYFYYFDVSNDAFAEALDRFSAFFSHPLFDESCVDKVKKYILLINNLSIVNFF